MNDFTASNGVKLSQSVGDGLSVTVPPDGYDGWQKLNLHASSVVALREFFQAEADERYGVWRSPTEPEVMVFKIDDDTIRLHHLRNGGVTTTFARCDQDGLGPLSAVARAYFDAHPEPKPWHDAKPGEVWLLTHGGAETAHVFTDRWTVANEASHAFLADRSVITPDDADITAGRRIWPEVSS